LLWSVLGVQRSGVTNRSCLIILRGGEYASCVCHARSCNLACQTKP
jgi:hypothetical protein